MTGVLGAQDRHVISFVRTASMQVGAATSALSPQSSKDTWGQGVQTYDLQAGRPATPQTVSIAGACCLQLPSGDANPVHYTPYDQPYTLTMPILDIQIILLLALNLPSLLPCPSPRPPAPHPPPGRPAPAPPPAAAVADPAATASRQRRRRRRWRPWSIRSERTMWGR